MTNIKRSNSVRFTLADVPDEHDLGTGTKRSAWKSEEYQPSIECRDRQDVPPRRPSRDLAFLKEIPANLFVDESNDVGNDQGHLRQQVRISSTQQHQQRRSILKNSKNRCASQTEIKPIKQNNSIVVN